MPYATMIERLEHIVEQISLPENFSIIIDRDQVVPNGRYYVQIQCIRRDVITGEMGPGRGRKHYLSEFDTKSQIVQAIFGLFMGYVEHEARENFQYRGRRVFGPHMDVDAVWTIARRVDIRDAQHADDSPSQAGTPT